MTTIFDIQRFSIHDGPGIRTTVFFKGCPLACAWCHNPEGRAFIPEIRTGSGGQEEIIGRQYSIRELVKEIEKDRIFYEQSDGGVTFSGGEAMVQDLDYLESLTKTLYDRGISIAIDTCGYCHFKRFERILPYTDLFLYDLKLLDDDEHRHYTAVSNKMILENLKKLSGSNARIFLRLIMIEGINTDDIHIDNLTGWLKSNCICLEKIDLLPYHELGSNKYEQLQGCRKAVIFRKPSEERLTEIRRKFAEIM